MTLPTIDDYVQEAIEAISDIARKSQYHGPKLLSFVELLTDQLIDLPYNIDHE